MTARRSPRRCASVSAKKPDVRTWLDRFEIKGGAGWWRQIERALETGMRRGQVRLALVGDEL